MDEFLHICEQAARAGGQVLLDWIGKFQTHEKGVRDLVTDADYASQAEITRVLLAAFPDHAVVGEEGEALGRPNAEYCWLVDPLDGTTNYVHKIPYYCVSVALMHRGDPLCGVVYDPITRECFTGTQRKGAYLNGNRITVSKTTQIGQAVIAVSFPPQVQPASRELTEFNRVAVACQSTRRTGSTALNLCYVAAGRFDAYWASHPKPWDVAAGALIVQEAGGMITGPDGAPIRWDAPRFVAAATSPLHAQLLQLVGDRAFA